MEILVHQGDIESLLSHPPFHHILPFSLQTSNLPPILLKFNEDELLRDDEEEEEEMATRYQEEWDGLDGNIGCCCEVNWNEGIVELTVNKEDEIHFETPFINHQNTKQQQQQEGQIVNIIPLKILATCQQNTKTMIEEDIILAF